MTVAEPVTPTTALTPRAGPRPLPEPEWEFVRGNRDAPDGTSETYTVCRLRVPKKRLDEEMQLGLHPHFLSLERRGECPAHLFLKAAAMKRARLGHATPPPSAVPLERWRASGLLGRPAEAVEVIQRDPDRSGDASSFTICRIAVPRERMVLEVKEGLHPGYHVRRRRGGSLGADDPRRLYVKGNPTEPFDNVDFPKSRKAPRGFGPRELCPFRLLRPGARIVE